MADNGKIRIAKDGPYLVSGKVPVGVVTIETNARRESMKWGEGAGFPVSEQVALCRCGRSDNKPFCNGSHAADPKFRDGIA